MFQKQTKDMMSHFLQNKEEFDVKLWIEIFITRKISLVLEQRNGLLYDNEQFCVVI